MTFPPAVVGAFIDEVGIILSAAAGTGVTGGSTLYVCVGCADRK